MLLRYSSHSLLSLGTTLYCLSTKKVLNAINISDKDILIENIKQDDTLNCVSELKNLDILFKKIENDN